MKPASRKKLVVVSLAEGLPWKARSTVLCSKGSWQAQSTELDTVVRATVLSRRHIPTIEPGEAVKISAVLDLATVRLLLLIHSKGEVRYAELGKLIPSRGTLTLSLKELDEEGLVVRRIVSSRPVKSYYSLTKNGTRIASLLEETKVVLAGT